MEYRDAAGNRGRIGEALGAGSILEGGVMTAGRDIRIDAQLVDVRTDEIIWAQEFTRELTAENVFAIQAEIARGVAQALEANLSDAVRQRLDVVPTRNLRALERYFAGKRLLAERTAAALRHALAELEAAVSGDPGFAAAWAGIAEAWLELPAYDADGADGMMRRKASSAAIRAVSLDPRSADALAVLGWYLLIYDFDWDGAERAFREALSISSTHANALHWYSHLLSWQGKHDDAITSARLAISADPLSIPARTNLNYVLLDARRWDEAFRMIDQIGEEKPYLSLLRNNWIGYLRAGRGQDASDLLLTWARESGRDEDAAAELGTLFVSAVDHGEAVDIDDELLVRLALQADAAEIYAAFRDADRTITALREASVAGGGIRSLLSMKINPAYDFVRDDPRFTELMTVVGLAD
jgi:tetratricopeptide (TPR) repeat protein